jgi:uncharacterized protein YjeT (DUF2065 family)
MKMLILLLGLILVLEGMPYVAAPETMQDWLKKISQVNPGQLRTLGLVAMLFGLAICFVVQKTSLLQL